MTMKSNFKCIPPNLFDVSVFLIYRYVRITSLEFYSSTKKNGVAFSCSTKNKGDGFCEMVFSRFEFVISTIFFVTSPFFSSSRSSDCCFSSAFRRISSIALSSAAIRSSSTRFFSLSIRNLSSANAFFSAAMRSSSCFRIISILLFSAAILSRFPDLFFH